MKSNNSFFGRLRKMLLLASFFIGLFGVFFAVAFFMGDKRLQGERLLDYKSFIASVSDKKLPYKFLSHRREDKDFLRGVRKYLRATRSEIKSEGKTGSIPKIIHQIWLFNDPPPPEVQYAMSTVQAQNPSYTYMFWTQEKVKEKLSSAFGSHLQHLFDSVSIGDYVAALILDEIGGFVIDPWSEALAPLDSLEIPQGVQVMVGVEPPLGKIKFGKRRIYASSGFMAAMPNHPLIGLWRKELYRRLGVFVLPFYEDWSSTGPYERMIWTSLDSLTQVMTQYSSQEKEVVSGVIAVGPTVWCPIRPKYMKEYHRFVSGELHRSYARKVRDVLGIALPPFSTIDSESIFIHLTGGRLGLKKKNLEKFLQCQLILARGEHSKCEGAFPGSRILTQKKSKVDRYKRDKVKGYGRTAFNKSDYFVILSPNLVKEKNKRLLP